MSWKNSVGLACWPEQSAIIPQANSAPLKATCRWEVAGLYRRHRGIAQQTIARFVSCAGSILCLEHHGRALRLKAGRRQHDLNRAAEVSCTPATSCSSAVTRFCEKFRTASPYRVSCSRRHRSSSRTRRVTSRSRRCGTPRRRIPSMATAGTGRAGGTV